MATEVNKLNRESLGEEERETVMKLLFSVAIELTFFFFFFLKVFVIFGPFGGQTGLQRAQVTHCLLTRSGPEPFASEAGVPG